MEPLVGFRGHGVLVFVHPALEQIQLYYFYSSILINVDHDI